MSDQGCNFVGHWQILVGHCPMTDGYLQPCYWETFVTITERNVRILQSQVRVLHEMTIAACIQQSSTCTTFVSVCSPFVLRDQSCNIWKKEHLKLKTWKSQLETTLSSQIVLKVKFWVVKYRGSRLEELSPSLWGVLAFKVKKHNPSALTPLTLIPLPSPGMLSCISWTLPYYCQWNCKAHTKAERSSLLDDISFFGDSDLLLFFRKLLNGDCKG